MYEIQRGYNLKGSGDDVEDDGDPRDFTICGSGAFNKITNIMSEILKGAETIFITDDAIKMKTEASIKEQAAQAIAAGHLSLQDFTPPDDDGDIFLTANAVQQMRPSLLNELSHFFTVDGEPPAVSKQRRDKIAGYLDYQLTSTPLQSVVSAGKGKGKAS